LQPSSGSVRVFGLEPHRQEVEVKSRLCYVPDTVAFYPWMTVSQTLEFLASFRPHWNQDIEADLLKRFQLDPAQKTSNLSRGQRTQLALIGAVCPEPELLVLDEPTSGLDPIVRREFIQTVIGAYHASDPDHRTVFVSTHLISEFEGLIDEFTIIEQGRELMTMAADGARERFQKIRVSFPQPPTDLDLAGALSVRQAGRDLEILADGNSKQLIEKLRARHPDELRCDSLTLEEIFVAAGTLAKARPL
jgi:ABC-2 type transport system ATP-binding protein